MTKRSRVRFGVIGCGAVSMKYHLPALRKSQWAELVGVADLDLSWAQGVAKHFGAQIATDDYRHLVGKIDAALIATPNASHYSIGMDLLKSGVHILCDKPLATTADHARQMFVAAQGSGTRLMAGHVRRFMPHLQLLKRLLSQQYLGRITEIRCSLGGDIRTWPARTGYRMVKEQAGGGVMLDVGVHLIDLVLWLTEDTPETIDYASTDLPGLGVEDNAYLRMKMTGGSLAEIACSYTSNMKGQLVVGGELGWAKSNINGGTIEIWHKRSRTCRLNGSLTLVPPAADCYSAQLDHFCRCLVEQKPFLVEPESVVRGLEVVEMCYADARRNGR